MIFKKFFRFGRNAFRFGSTFASIGKNLAVQGKDMLLEKYLGKKEDEGQTSSKQGANQAQQNPLEVRRKNLEKNFSMPDPNDPAMKAKMESMLHSQGVSDFSGSSYDGADSPGHRTNHNMFQRNYDNHQGN